LRRSLTPDEIKLVQVISFRTGVIPSREKERSQYTAVLCLYLVVRPSVIYAGIVSKRMTG